MYSVKEISKISGVSTRTIRYYDEIGLLKPAVVNDSGYRFYSENEVNLLQQILFYREFGVSLAEIKTILYSSKFDTMDALKEHRKKLISEKNRLDILIKTLDKTILKEAGEYHMTDQEKFNGFKEKIIEENELKHGKEIRKKYGDSEVEQGNQKFRSMTQQQYEEMQEIEQELFEKLEFAVNSQLTPDSETANEIAMLHKKWLLYSWNEYSIEKHKNLTDMYLCDERFIAYYDRNIKGVTQFLRDAVHNIGA